MWADARRTGFSELEATRLDQMIRFGGTRPRTCTRPAAFSVIHNSRFHQSLLSVSDVDQ